MMRPELRFPGPHMMVVVSDCTRSVKAPGVQALEV